MQVNNDRGGSKGGRGGGEKSYFAQAHTDICHREINW